MPKYIKVAKTSEMPPGAAREFHADGHVIALFNVNGQLHCLDNTCMHRGGPLGQGALEGNIVTCPWHGWQYNVTTGEAVFNEQIKVKRYEVKVEGEDIVVGFDE
jgi:nitrite reductase/ring-hydroxylating ferredoxin subunit